MSGRKEWIAQQLVDEGWRRRYCTEPWRGAIVLDRPLGATGSVWSIALGARGSVSLRDVGGRTIHYVPAALPDDAVTLAGFHGWINYITLPAPPVTGEPR